jgi:hypothetical protein
MPSQSKQLQGYGDGAITQRATLKYAIIFAHRPNFEITKSYISTLISYPEPIHGELKYLLAFPSVRPLLTNTIMT